MHVMLTCSGQRQLYIHGSMQQAPAYCKDSHWHVSWHGKVVHSKVIHHLLLQHEGVEGLHRYRMFMQMGLARQALVRRTWCCSQQSSSSPLHDAVALTVEHDFGESIEFSMPITLWHLSVLHRTHSLA